VQVPGLAVVIVGDRKDSQTYVRMKKKACEEVGIASLGEDLPSTASQEQVLDVVRRLNSDPNVHGILVQLPVRLLRCYRSPTPSLTSPSGFNCIHYESSFLFSWRIWLVRCFRAQMHCSTVWLKQHGPPYSKPFLLNLQLFLTNPAKQGVLW
jgi:hypothetical protein